MGGYNLVVKLNDPGNGGIYTNADKVSGVVELSTTKSLKLSCITVKLEGEAYSLFVIRDSTLGRRRRAWIENDRHKFLYKCMVVFPPKNLLQASKAKDFTLAAGSYTYDFSFEIPLTTSCKKEDRVDDIVHNMNVLDLDIKKDGSYTENRESFIGHMFSADRITQQKYHVVTLLPPSMLEDHLGFVKYYVKATCERPTMFKMNLRTESLFHFSPLDIDESGVPLGQALVQSETQKAHYRKRVILRKMIGPKSLKIDLASRFAALSVSLSALPENAPMAPGDMNVTFEVRIPRPTFLSPNSIPRIQLFIILDGPSSPNEKGRPPQGLVYLHRLIIDIEGTTNFSVIDESVLGNRRHQARLEESYPVFDTTFHHLPLDFLNARPAHSGSSQYELEIPQTCLSNWRFPYGMVPTFETCNIRKTYALRVAAGISIDGVHSQTNQSEIASKVNFVEIVCPEVRILSGQRALHAPLYDSSKPNFGTQVSPEKENHNASPVPRFENTQHDGSSALPTYSEDPLR